MAIHQFCTEDAAKYGIEEAIILWNIGFWCATNLAKRQNIHDGNVWTYNPLKAYLEFTPYLCPRKPELDTTEYPDEESRQKAEDRELKRRIEKIRRIFKSLEDQGAIVIGNYNKVKYDRTAWYALADPKKLSKYAEISPQALRNLIPQNCGMESIELWNGVHKFVEPIPDNKQQIINPRKSKSVNNAHAQNFSLDAIVIELHGMGMPQKEDWYAKRKAQEYMERFPGSKSVADACRYVVNAIDHAWELEGKAG